jgi:hypothetical protein
VPTIDELVVADEPGPWRAAGFHVEGQLCEVGSVRIRLEGKGPMRGIVRWSLRDAGSPQLDSRDSPGALDSLDGLDTRRSDAPPPTGGRHPNGVVAIDHVVVMSPDLDRTVTALRAAGFDLRRIREGATPGGSVRQAFFRMAEVILEVVQAPENVKLDPDGPARLWGISFLVEDMDITAAALGDLLGSPRAAVQPGRQIATLRRGAGLGPAIAFMTPGAGAI